jgi:hypothetical protein
MRMKRRGFHDGWGQATNQLGALAQRILSTAHGYLLKIL